MRKSYLYFTILILLFILYTQIVSTNDVYKIGNELIIENKNLKDSITYGEKLKDAIARIERRSPKIGGILKDSVVEISNHRVTSETKENIDNLPQYGYEIDIKEKVLKNGPNQYSRRDNSFEWPFFGNEFYISSEFGSGYIRYVNEYNENVVIYRKIHDGIDISNKVGIDVFASKTGTVYYVHDKIHPIYGKYVKVYHKDPITGKKNVTVYCHLDNIYVKNGDNIVRGKSEKDSTRIGTFGETGYTYGPHLHFELWELDDESGKWYVVNFVNNSTYGKYSSIKYNVNK